ncbi:MAG: esterase family protein [Acidimicrobiia bacterium]|nr:esterase family protein [Acidimicrobiia bacterium]
MGGLAVTLLLVAVPAACGSPGPGGTGAHRPAVRPFHAWSCLGNLSSGGGLRVTGVRRLDERTADVTMTTAALAAPVTVRLMVPPGCDRRPGRRYPVLYLLHGAGGDHTAWTTGGDVARLTERRPVVVVMPDGGRGGWYTNWWNFGALGPPEWETFHVGQLVPWVDRHLPTRASGGERAIAGLSMGGFGAVSYAARHPDLFTAASSYSGALGVDSPIAELVIDIPAADDGGRPGQVFGTMAANEVRWRGHSPTDLAANLRGLRIAFYTGDGRAGPLDPGGGFDGLEAQARLSAVAFAERLDALGIPYTFGDYGPGHHTWAYFRRSLASDLPGIMAAFHRGPSVGPTFRYAGIEPSYEIAGWRVAIERTATELGVLDASAARFAVSGSGTATVRTPAGYRRPGTYLARVTSRGVTTTRRVRAGTDGRIGMTVTLGPPNPHQQYTPEAEHTSRVFTTTVEVAARRARPVRARR